ncbi:hypothetical protein CVO74_00840 [Xanthomonas prunicola]|jgi:hypothetical protein|uniref:Uncharacterized protein n=1 Tax=Xanthomonas prunicola TaxID=2053930 RepID=A0A2N3RPT8_9XANT|nr:hypothetical protein XpruCFBP8353_05615 [Xanthomonas prunicola]PKV18800.1 hypothetical protein XpruCFBP8354_05615 [Xanthomonas prunicola]PKV21892.1 hypothetical protein CVO74_00840 [Xanthomonas prunicola]
MLLVGDADRRSLQPPSVLFRRVAARSAFGLEAMPLMMLMLLAIFRWFRDPVRCCGHFARRGHSERHALASQAWPIDCEA